MTTSRGLLLLPVILVAFSTPGHGNCPFSESHGERHLPRGHNKPFGHHAKAWKRIHTVYEHPHPQDFYNDFLRQSKPLVIKGGAKDWPAIHKWKNVSYLNSLGGKERSDVNWKQIYDYDRHHAIRIDMSMKEFTEKMETHNIYMDATILTGMHDDVYWPHSLGCQFYLKRVKQLAILMNNGRSKSDVHTDVTDTYFMQTTGRRLWLLAPTDQVANMYSGNPHLIKHSTVSILNQTHMDLEKHSATLKVPIYAAFLYPGDIIYVPEGWFHQVVTDGSPNIAIVAFMNVLFCEYTTRVPGTAKMTDDEYLTNCVTKVLQKKPRKLECEAFPERNMTITELLQKYKPRTVGSFKVDFQSSSKQRFLNYAKRLPDRSILPAMAVSLTGMTSEALKKGAVLKQSVIEGYRFFCTAPGDGSEEAFGKFFFRMAKIRKNLRLLSYLSVDTPAEKVADSIEKSLVALQTPYIDIVLLKAPYCVPDYSVGACTRDAFSNSWMKTWAALEAMQAAGKIRYLGVSDFSLQELQQLYSAAKSKIVMARARFDVYFRNLQFRHFCRDNNILFMGRSVLGQRWKTEAPDFPENRDIFKEFWMQDVAYKHKISIHAAAYDFAIKKNVIVAPKVNNPLYVRVNIKAIDSESTESIDGYYPIDNFDPNDHDGLTAADAVASDFSHSAAWQKIQKGAGGEVEQDKTIKSEELEEIRENDMVAVGKKSAVNYSEETYTDENDFEVFPRYMLRQQDEDTT